MNKELRMKIKLLEIIVCVLVLVVLLLSGIRVITGLEKEKRTITAAEAVRLSRALSQELYEEGSPERERYDKVLGKLEGERGLTDAEYIELLGGLDGGKGIVDQEQAGGKGAVERSEFLDAYFGLVKAYGLEEVISEKRIGVMAGAEDGVYVAADGVYHDLSGMTGEYCGQTVGAICRGQDILTVEAHDGAQFQASNVWIMEAGREGLRCFYHDREFRLEASWEAAGENGSEQVADLIFRDGALLECRLKTEKLSGKILRMTEKELELEGAGTYSFTDDFTVYKLYGELKSYARRDLKVGYAFTDFVLEDGRLAAGLVTKDERMENIRVLIKAGDYAGSLHEDVTLRPDTDYKVLYEGGEETRPKDEEIRITKDSPYFEKGSRVVIEPLALTGKTALTSVHRSQGIPKYRGKIELIREAEGLIVVNEVLLEEYLYAVVPSEMPASYPLEALKAQAVCARTYAYRSMVNAGLPQYGAHVDDSTSYQVYNNILENSETTKAVRETKGELIFVGEEPAGAYYYSTSCGYGTNADIWKGGSSENTQYLQPGHIGEGEGSYSPQELTDNDTFEDFITSAPKEDYENAEPWYRWSYTVEKLDPKLLEQRIRTRYEANPGQVLTLKEGEYVSKPVEKLGEVKDIYVEKRNPGGVIDELIVEGSGGTYKIITEYSVRYVLSDTVTKVVRQDGSAADASVLLPSSFFAVFPGKEGDVVVGYKLIGGGFGHGVGMSQNAARSMAQLGMDSRGILTFFYKDSRIEKVY